MSRIMVLYVSVAITFTICVAACGDSDDGVSSDPAPREKWEALSASEYTIDQVRICECPLAGDSIRLGIEADTLSDAFNRTAGRELTDQERVAYLTVEELFDWIEQLEGQNVYRLEITYDSATGYPDYIYVDHDQGIADDEIAIYTQLVSLEPLPTNVHRRRWALAGADDYVVQQWLVCLCIFGGEETRLTVVVDSIAAAYNVPQDLNLTPSQWVNYRTITGLFDMIARADTTAEGDVAIKYDSTYGYPKSVYIDWRVGTADEESFYTTELVHLGPGP